MILRNLRRDAELRRLSNRLSALTDELSVDVENMHLKEAAEKIVEIVPLQVTLMKVKSEKLLNKFEETAIQFFKSSVIVALLDEDFAAIRPYLVEGEYEVIERIDLEQAKESVRLIQDLTIFRMGNLASAEVYLSDSSRIKELRTDFEAFSTLTNSAATAELLKDKMETFYAEFSTALGISLVEWTFEKNKFFFKMGRGDRRDYVHHIIVNDFTLALKMVVAEKSSLELLMQFVNRLEQLLFM